MYDKITLRAAGVTPSILDAWDKFLGLIFVSFSMISVDKLGINSYLRLGGISTFSSLVSEMISLSCFLR